MNDDHRVRTVRGSPTNLTRDGPKADYDAHREGTIAVPIAYVKALEVLASTVFESTATDAEAREARREVANRTGRDAPYVWEREP